MRTLVLGSMAAMAVLAGEAATAQTRVVGHGPGSYRSSTHASQWGSRIGGRWWGGANAPGGWGAYRRPVRGYALPTYWIAPRFYVTDWAGYGLATPPRGYRWSRYYDDAVLIDSRGSVYDTVSGVDWDGDGGAGYARGDYGAGYPAPGYERRDDGLGGAAVGAVVGGVAGNLIAGRGNRLGGTLIGAGVGAAAGYAVDRGEDRRRWAPPPPPPPGAYGAPYDPPATPYYDDVSPPPYRGHGPSSWTSPDGSTTVVTTTAGGFYGAGTTTVTVQSQPAVTTTTTEVYEDRVTYSRPAVRKIYKRRWVRPRCACK